MAKQEIRVEDLPITIIEEKGEKYICLTDIARKKGDRHDIIIQTWMRARPTLNFLKTWEVMYNPDFKYSTDTVFKGFETIEKEFLNDNAFMMYPSKWIEYTNAKGIISKKGRYGGTFAHEDIALEFASWVSPEFKLFVIREFKRLKEDEARRLNYEWDLRRELAKAHYPLLLEAVKNSLPEKAGKKIGFYFAEEADFINQLVFGMTAKKWREKNPNLTGNMRDFASTEQLLLVSDLQLIDAKLLAWDCDKEMRADILSKFANELKINYRNSKSLDRIREMENKILK